MGQVTFHGFRVFFHAAELFDSQPGHVVLVVPDAVDELVEVLHAAPVFYNFLRVLALELFQRVDVFI